MEKQKVTLFDKLNLTDKTHAQKVYERECFKFRIKLICALLAILPSICLLIYKSVAGIPILATLVDVVGAAGWIATLVSCPLTILKGVWKLVKMGWSIVPFFFFDLVGAAFGFVVAIFILVYAPVVYCAYGLYQCYLHKREAEEYLTTETTMN